MAHYAFLDENNIVTQVIVGVDETDLIDGKMPEEWYENIFGQKCLRTSYNNNIRGNFAGIGMIYNEELDAFLYPKPSENWVLDDNYQWVPPTPYPGNENEIYGWDEETQSWKLAEV